MQNFTKALKEANTGSFSPLISKEVAASKQGVYSKTLRSILAAYYPNDPNALLRPSKKALLSLLTKVVEGAAGQREGKITRQWMAMYKELDKLIKTLYPNESTSEVVFTEFRKPIRAKYGDNSEIYKQAVYTLGVSRERSIQRKEEYKAKVAQKGMTRRQQTPYFDDEIYKIIDENISSANPLEQVVAVMLATGSRFIEVMKVSEYKKSQQHVNRDLHYITIKGIAKDKANAGYENKIVVRPLIRVNNSDIIKAVKSLRDKLDLSGDNTKISDRYNSQLNKIVRRIFGRDDTTSHKLRYISSNLAYLLYGEGSTENVFVQNYLGHESGETSRTYQSINVKLRGKSGFTQDTPQQYEAKISALESDMKNNFEDHTQIRNEVRQVEARTRQPVNRVVNIDIDVQYPQYINPNQRGELAEANRIQLLTELYRRARSDGIVITYRDLKSKYKYGSKTLTEFNRMVRNGQIQI